MNIGTQSERGERKEGRDEGRERKRERESMNARSLRGDARRQA